MVSDHTILIDDCKVQEHKAVINIRECKCAHCLGEPLREGYAEFITHHNEDYLLELADVESAPINSSEAWGRFEMEIALKDAELGDYVGIEEIEPSEPVIDYPPKSRMKFRIDVFLALQETRGDQSKSDSARCVWCGYKLRYAHKNCVRFSEDEWQAAIDLLENQKDRSLTESELAEIDTLKMKNQEDTEL